MQSRCGISYVHIERQCRKPLPRFNREGLDEGCPDATTSFAFDYGHGHLGERPTVWGAEERRLVHEPPWRANRQTIFIRGKECLVA